MKINEFENFIQKNVGNGPNSMLTGAVFGVVNKSGDRYFKTFGKTSVDSTTPLKDDATFWLASATKLVTSVAALKAIELGYFTLDEPASRLVQELNSPDIVTGVDSNGALQYKKATVPITVRQLLTHTAGVTYDPVPLLLKWRESRGQTPQWLSGDFDLSYNTPLIFEPGSAWAYSPGTDWVGQMIQRASGLKLEEFMKKYIWDPLGTKDTTFLMSQRPDLQARLMPYNSRAADGTISTDPIPGLDRWPMDAKDNAGGAGLWSTTSDYLKFLEAILRNDGTLVKKELIDEMFSPQLEDMSSFNAQVYAPEGAVFRGGVENDESHKFNWGLGSLLWTNGVKGMRGPGTLAWGGLPNIIWWIDRANETVGLMMTQLIPTGEPGCAPVKQAFLKMGWEEFGKHL